jgi:hypothetical protein
MFPVPVRSGLVHLARSKALTGPLNSANPPETLDKASGQYYYHAYLAPSSAPIQDPARSVPSRGVIFAPLGEDRADVLSRRSAAWPEGTGDICSSVLYQTEELTTCRIAVSGSALVHRLSEPWDRSCRTELPLKLAQTPALNNIAAKLVPTKSRQSSLLPTLIARWA